MTLAERIHTDSNHVASCDDADILDMIREEGTNLAIWERRIGPSLPDSRRWPTIDDIGLTTPVCAVDAALRTALAAADYPSACVAALADDIGLLATSVARITGCDAVSIRLEIVETDACRRFHADHVTVRLITTYAGRGTQWLSDADAAALRRGVDLADLHIRSLAPGDVALFKGLGWAPDGAIVHRSPPIAASGEQRLVLVIDPAPSGKQPMASP